MPNFQALKRFTIQLDGREISAKPGMILDIPNPQAYELQRAGMGCIISSNPAREIPNPHQVQDIRLVENKAVVDTTRHGVIALIVNYNMPECTDKLVEYIKDNCKGEVETIVIDNGSDLCKPSQYTTLALAKNIQTTNGWLMGLHYIDALSIIRGFKPFAYWFLITSTEFIEGDPLSPMLELLNRDTQAVGVHPALQADCNTAWTHLKTQGTAEPRPAWMIDNVAALYRADWFDSIGRFDPALTFAWGIDLETGYLARKQGRTLWVHEGSHARKITDIGYTMNRMNMSARERQQKASQNMLEVLRPRYGNNWEDMLLNDYLQPDDLVSVIVPTFNRPTLLPRALDSLKDQTYKNFEAIVINDGGTDVKDIVACYPFVRYIAHEKNKGLSAARNTGLKAAKGRYIAYLDDDDWYHPNHLAILVKAIWGRQAVYSDAEAIDRVGSPTSEHFIFKNDYDAKKLPIENLFPCNAVLHEKSLIDEVGYFDESLENSEDWDMWVRMSKIVNWFHVPVITCVVDRTRPTMSSNVQAMRRTFALIHARYGVGGKHEMMPVKEREYSAVDIDKTMWAGAHPFGISGCIRVRNDSQFLRAAVLTHLPYMDEIVLAYQPSEDDTESVCESLVNEFPAKVRMVRYPVAPVFIFTPKWESTPVDSVYSFVYLSNWAISQCRYSWIAKFEADVIALSSLSKVVEAIKKEPNRRMYYGRALVNIGGPECDQFSEKIPCTGGFDEAFFPNHPDWHFIKNDKWEAVDQTVAEYRCIGWGGLHLKRSKARNWGKIDEPFQPFDSNHFKAVMTDWSKMHSWPGPDNPLGEPFLFENDWKQYISKPNGYFRITDPCPKIMDSEPFPPQLWIHPRMYAWALSYASKDQIVADMGTGYHYRPFRYELAKRVEHVYAVDHNPEILKQRQAERLQFVVSDFTKAIPEIEEGSLDRIFFMQCLEQDYVNDALAQAVRLLKSDGSIILACDAPYDLDKPMGQWKGLDIKALIDDIRKIGLCFDGPINQDKTKAVVHNEWNLCSWHCVLKKL